MSESGRTDKELLESLAKFDELQDPDEKDTCGQCFQQFCMAQAARDLLKTEGCPTLVQWDAEYKRRFEEGKFFKLWHEEQTAGRDPHIAFKERGWEP